MYRKSYTLKIPLDFSWYPTEFKCQRVVQLLQTPFLLLMGKATFVINTLEILCDSDRAPCIYLAFTLVLVLTSNTPVYVNILKKNDERMLHSLSEARFSSVPDPDPIGPVDPDPNWESVSKKAKMTHIKSEKISRLEVLYVIFGGTEASPIKFEHKPKNINIAFF
jgi:hypothetical protein